jgi:hypothetical protein
MKLAPLIQMPNTWSGLAGRFGVHLFEGHLGVADMGRLESIGAEWLREHPGKLVELVVIFPSNSRMTGEERSRMARVIKRWEKDRLASATVILASGLLGAMHRSVLTGLLMIAPPPHPSKVFATVPEAVTWLAPHMQSLLGAEATRHDLLTGVEDWCAAFRGRAPDGKPGR